MRTSCRRAGILAVLAIMLSICMQAVPVSADAGDLAYVDLTFTLTQSGKYPGNITLPVITLLLPDTTFITAVPSRVQNRVTMEDTSVRNVANNGSHVTFYVPLNGKAGDIMRYRVYYSTTLLESGYNGEYWCRVPLTVANPNAGSVKATLEIPIDVSSFVAAGLMNPDGSDVRVVDSSGGTYPCFVMAADDMVYINGTWPAGNSTVYLEFFNPLDTDNTWEGTLILYDDFSGDMSLWGNYTFNSLATITGGELLQNIAPTYGGCHTYTLASWNMSDAFEIRYTMRYPSYYNMGGNNHYIYLMDPANVTYERINYAMVTNGEYAYIDMANGGELSAGFNTRWSVTVWGNGSFTRQKIWGDGYISNTTAAITNWSNIVGFAQVSFHSGTYDGLDTYYDDIVIRDREDYNQLEVACAAGDILAYEVVVGTVVSLSDAQLVTDVYVPGFGVQVITVNTTVGWSSPTPVNDIVKVIDEYPTGRYVLVVLPLFFMVAAAARHNAAAVGAITAGLCSSINLALGFDLFSQVMLGWIGAICILMLVVEGRHTD